MTLFRAGEEGYSHYRIPAIIATRSGGILAFCEGRRQGVRDYGEIDLVMKKSGDGGKTWSKLQVIIGDGANTYGNPAPVIDRLRGGLIIIGSQRFSTNLQGGGNAGFSASSITERAGAP